jgi:hypothetical protein
VSLERNFFDLPQEIADLDLHGPAMLGTVAARRCMRPFTSSEDEAIAGAVPDAARPDSEACPLAQALDPMGVVKRQKSAAQARTAREQATAAVSMDTVEQRRQQRRRADRNRQKLLNDRAEQGAHAADQGINA